MMKGVLTDGDGIVAHGEMPDSHVIDEPRFEQHAFTPYAVFDGAHGRRFQERIGPGLSAENWTDIEPCDHEDAKQLLSPDDFADRYRVLTGSEESFALAFRRKQQRIALLQRLAPGIEVSNSEYHAARMWKHVPGGGNVSRRAFDVFRVDTLQWKTGTAGGWHDFPQYLQAMHFHLDYATAWRLAWALVRAAYLDNWSCVAALLETAANESRKKVNTFDRELGAVIAQLKCRSLT